MDLVTRAKNICLTPKTEWPVIASESAETGAIITGYVLPLAAIGAVAGFIGSSIIGYTLPFVGYYRAPITTGIGSAIVAIVMAVISVFLVSYIVNALAPTFGAQKDPAQALKVTVYSYTPGWLAGVLQIMPVLGVLAILASLYGVYLLYLGLPKLMKCPEDKAVGYTVVTVICAVVLSLVLGVVGGILVGAGAMGNAMMGGGLASESNVDPDSSLGRLQELGRQMEDASAKMDEAEQSGDPEAGMAAAMEGLGALLGGGSRVDPLEVEELKTFVPDTLAGMPRIDLRTERSGLGSLLVARAEATYGDDDGRSVRLEILDSGGMSGVVGLAGWVGVRGEQEDESGSERTYEEAGRLIHERASKDGGTNEFAIVIGERFVISAESESVDVGGLKAAVSSIDLPRLESMKASGGDR